MQEAMQEAKGRWRRDPLAAPARATRPRDVGKWSLHVPSAPLALMFPNMDQHDRRTEPVAHSLEMDQAHSGERNTYQSSEITAITAHSIAGFKEPLTGRSRFSVLLLLSSDCYAATNCSVVFVLLLRRSSILVKIPGMSINIIK